MNIFISTHIVVGSFPWSQKVHGDNSVLPFDGGIDDILLGVHGRSLVAEDPAVVQHGRIILVHVTQHYVRLRLKQIEETM